MIASGHRAATRVAALFDTFPNGQMAQDIWFIKKNRKTKKKNIHKPWYLVVVKLTTPPSAWIEVTQNLSRDLSCELLSLRWPILIPSTFLFSYFCINKRNNVGPSFQMGPRKVFRLTEPTSIFSSRFFHVHYLFIYLFLLILQCWYLRGRGNIFVPQSLSLSFSQLFSNNVPINTNCDCHRKFLHFLFSKLLPFVKLLKMSEGIVHHFPYDAFSKRFWQWVIIDRYGKNYVGGFMAPPTLLWWAVWHSTTALWCLYDHSVRFGPYTSQHLLSSNYGHVSGMQLSII